MRRFLVNFVTSVFVTCMLSGVMLAADAQAKKSAAKEQRTPLTAREAASRAKAQYGGKVLKVSKQGNAYKVRLLQDSGRVLTVTIRG